MWRAGCGLLVVERVVDRVSWTLVHACLLRIKVGHVQVVRPGRWGVPW